MVKIRKDARVRFNLSFYAQSEFANQIYDRFEPFGPYRDTGIDIAGRDRKTDRYRNFQIEARNMGKYGNYWFALKDKKLDKTLKIKSMYWAFGMVQPNLSVDFVVLPVKLLGKWREQSIDNSVNNILAPDSKHFWLKLKQDGQKVYTMPLKGSQDVTKYKLENILQKL